MKRLPPLLSKASDSKRIKRILQEADDTFEEQDEFEQIEPQQAIQGLRGLPDSRVVIHNRFYRFEAVIYWVEVSHHQTSAFLVFIPGESTESLQFDLAVSRELPLTVADKLLRDEKGHATRFVRRCVFTPFGVKIRGLDYF
jgi:hypothetical protein